MERNIITIDQGKCTGCALCIPNCPEGAIRIIDGKARLVSDLMCDGLGACLGHCPEDAITIEKREAGAYDERKVMENIVTQGTAAIAAHLKHLSDHGQTVRHREASSFLADRRIPLPSGLPAHPAAHQGCPGSRTVAFDKEAATGPSAPQPSRLGHWPVQMHLLSPHAPHFHNADFLLAADCTAFALGNFHEGFLKGTTLGIACPKLDAGQEAYVDKIRALIDEAAINTLTVAIMEAPCCRGLLQCALEAAAQARRKVPIKSVTVSIRGEILSEERC